MICAKVQVGQNHRLGDIGGNVGLATARGKLIESDTRANKNLTDERKDTIGRGGVPVICFVRPISLYIAVAGGLLDQPSVAWEA
jgi:hypothetical protein